MIDKSIESISIENQLDWEKILSFCLSKECKVLILRCGRSSLFTDLEEEKKKAIEEKLKVTSCLVALVYQGSTFDAYGNLCNTIDLSFMVEDDSEESFMKIKESILAIVEEKSISHLKCLKKYFMEFCGDWQKRQDLISFEESKVFCECARGIKENENGV